MASGKKLVTVHRPARTKAFHERHSRDTHEELLTVPSIAAWTLGSSYDSWTPGSLHDSCSASAVICSIRASQPAGFLGHGPDKKSSLVGQLSGGSFGGLVVNGGASLSPGLVGGPISGEWWRKDSPLAAHWRRVLKGLERVVGGHVLASCFSPGFPPGEGSVSTAQRAPIALTLQGRTNRP